MQKSTFTKIAMAEGASIRPEKKEIQLQKEEVQLADGSTMKPLQVRNADDGLKATLLILFKHVADMHISVMEIISEKFGLDIDEMHLAIKDHPKWIAMFDNPMVSDLTFDVFKNSEKKSPATTSVASPPSSPKSSASGKKAGRPKMTDEQKAAAKAKREAAKKAPATGTAPAPATKSEPAPAPASSHPPSTPENWACGHCSLGPGNDHRMCICKAYNYSVEAWEKARIFPEDDFILEDTPVPAPPPKRKLKK